MSHLVCYTVRMKMIMKEMENMNEAKLKLWARSDEMKAQQAASKKREEEEAYWNAPLDTKDRD